MREIYLNEIKKKFDFQVIGNNVKIDGLNLCNRDSKFSSIMSYVTNSKYVDYVNNNKNITCLVLTLNDFELYKNSINRDITYLIHSSPETLFYNIHNYLYFETDFYDHYNFETRIGNNVNIHKSVQIDKGVIIGDDVNIGANTVIKKGSIIDSGVTIGCNSTIGSEGFQIISGEHGYIHVVHAGRTRIHSNVYIGDNCAVCNSLFEGETIVGENSKIDNLVHIAHNSYVGKNVVITAGVILCGSSVLLDNAWIGVNTSILNNVVIGKNSIIGIGSVVTRSIPDNSKAYGVPAKVHQ